MNSSTSPDPSSTPASAGERRLARLVVATPSAYKQDRRIDWIHDPLPAADADDTDPQPPEAARQPHCPEA